jgi:hypothetical protein
MVVSPGSGWSENRRAGQYVINGTPPHERRTRGIFDLGRADVRFNSIWPRFRAASRYLLGSHVEYLIRIRERRDGVAQRYEFVRDEP